MKNILIPCVLLMLSTITSHAQSWQWGTAGISATAASYVAGFGVAVDAAGNSYGAGLNIGSAITFGGTVTIPYSWITTGNQAVWAKFDSLGNVLWAGGTQGGNAAPIGITADTAGNLIVFGNFYDSMQIGGTTFYAASPSVAQYFLAKFAPSGTLLWAIKDGEAGGMGNVTTDAAGNIYITSVFVEPTMTIGPYTFTNASTGRSADIFVAKYTSSGTVVWASSIGGTDGDYSCDIAVASTGYVYMTGQTHSPSFMVGSSVCSCPPGTSLDVSLIAKFSPTGVPVWGQVADGHSARIDLDAIAADTAGNVYMAGTFADTTISFGTTTLTKPSPDSLKAGFIVRYTPADTVDWSRVIGAAGDISPYSVAVSRCGWVWVCGSYTGNAYIGRDTLALASGPDPAFIIGYNISRPLVEYTGIGSGADNIGGDDITRIACDKKGSVFLCGDYGMSGLIFGHDTLPYMGGEPFFIAKYNPAFPCCLASVGGPAIAIASSFGDTVCLDSMITFTATHSSAGATPSYQWVVNGHPVGRDTAAYSYIPTAGDSIYCIITSNNPCSVPDTAMSNKISVVVRDCKAGIASLMPDAVQIAPNPAGSEFTIHLTTALPKGSRADLEDVTGRIVSSQLLSGRNTVISVRSLTTGIYLCRITSANGEMVIKRIAVIR